MSPDTAITEPIGPSRSWGPIDSLRLVGRGAVLPLSVAQSKITVGAGSCDVVMPATVAGDIALHQTTIVRIAQTGAICVRDRASTDHLVRPGELFYLAGVPILATDARLELIRTRLAWCIGLTNHAAVDEALEIVAEGRPIALLGPPGMDALPLAQTSIPEMHAVLAYAEAFGIVGAPAASTSPEGDDVGGGRGSMN